MHIYLSLRKLSVKLGCNPGSLEKRVVSFLLNYIKSMFKVLKAHLVHVNLATMGIEYTGDMTFKCVFQVISMQ